MTIAQALLVLQPASAQNVFPSSGNVGIGTTSPAYPLDVVGAVSATGLLSKSGPLYLDTVSHASDLVFGGNYMVLKSGGNVGIGTTTPNTALDVNGTLRSVGETIPTGGVGVETSYNASGGFIIAYDRTSNLVRPLHLGGTGFAITIDSASNVGIGTTAPGGPLHVIANQNNGLILQTSSAASNLMAFVDGSATPHTWWVGQGLSNTTDGVFTIYDQTGGVSRLNILRNGNVGIGTTNPTEKLSVNGKIQAKEIIVNTGWADHVFRPSYRLRPLTEVAAYIDQNHHLPEIPSKEEVQRNGVGLADMQVKLLIKIEELTLHMIKAEQRNTDLQDEVRALRLRIDELEHDKAATPKQ